MIQDKRLQYICSVDDCDYFIFKARLFHYFYTRMAPYENLFSRLIRESIDFFRGKYYPVYQVVEGEIVAYATVVRGGGRYTFCGSNDIVICNVWVNPAYRGKGLSSKLIKAITQHCNLFFSVSYAFIRHDNLASIKCFEANGYHKVLNATTSGILHRVIEDSDGRLGVYKYTKK